MFITCSLAIPTCTQNNLKPYTLGQKIRLMYKKGSELVLFKMFRLPLIYCCKIITFLNFVSVQEYEMRKLRYGDFSLIYKAMSWFQYTNAHMNNFEYQYRSPKNDSKESRKNIIGQHQKRIIKIF